MKGILAGVPKLIASKYSLEWGSKSSLLFKAPVGAILRGIYFDHAPSGNYYLQCVILPLHMPSNGIYYIDGPQIGFGGQSRLRPVTESKLWATRDEYISGLEDIVVNQLRSEWDRLAHVDYCIDYFLSLNGYVYKHGRHVFEALIYLTAYQQRYSHCISIIQEYKQLFPEKDPMKLHVDSYPQAYWQRIELIEECIKAEDFQRLHTKLNEWFDYSIKALGLSRFV